MSFWPSFQRHLLMLICLATASGAALADDVYRWTDASGAVSYGQKPPADARSVRKVDVNNTSVIPAANTEADQKLADSYARARSQRLEQEAAESHIAAEKARADLDRQTALLEAQRAGADANCAATSSCSDQGGYYPIYGLSTRGYYPGNGFGQGYPGRPQLPTHPGSGVSPLPTQRGQILN